MEDYSSNEKDKPDKPEKQRRKYYVLYNACIELLASERSERDTLRSVQLRIGDIYIYTRKMVPIPRRASSYLKKYSVRFKKK